MYIQFFVIFALILIGFFLGRRGILDERTNAGINKMIMRLIVPCMFLYKIGNLEMERDTLREFFLTTAIFTAILLLCGLYARIYSKARRFPAENSNVAEFCMVLPNNAFMGFPVASTFFGEIGLLMMAATNAAMNIFMFSYGVMLMERNGERKRESFGRRALRVARHMVNPMMGALVLSLVICGFHIMIPEMLNALLSEISGLCTPLAMLYIGSTLSRGNFAAVLRSRAVLEASFNKIIVMPLITWAIVFALPGLGPVAKAMCVVASSMPTAAMTAMLAGDHEQDTEMAGMILLVTTAFSALTMAAFIQLVHAFLV